MPKIKIEKQNKEAPPKFMGRFGEDGGLNFGSYTKMWLKKFIKENPNMPFELKPLFPESEKQRNWFEGALVPLVTFYQEGMDYRNYKDLDKVREWLKVEFNAEIVKVAGKLHKIGKSTKNSLSQGFLERVTDWLIENYASPMEALDPKKYKHWRDAIKMNRSEDTFIDYLLAIKLLHV